MGDLKKSYICGCEHRMSRPLHLVIAMLLLISMGMVVTSCSSDGKDDEPVIDNTSELYGTWISSGTSQSTNNGVNVTTNWENIILFNSRNILLSQYFADSFAEGGGSSFVSYPSNSLYEIVDNTIKVYEVVNGTSTESLLSYKIFGNNLIMEYVSGDKPSILNGKDRVVYTNKSKVDLVEYPYGSWNATMSMGNSQRKFYLNFFMDSELTFNEQRKDSQYLTTLEKYRYEFTGNKIDIYQEDNLSTKPDCILSYKVIGDNITLEYISGEKPLFISVFNSDKATYEINK